MSDSPGESDCGSFCLCKRTEALKEDGAGAILAGAHAWVSLMEELFALVRLPPSTIFVAKTKLQVPGN